jgi:hypothetical protein
MSWLQAIKAVLEAAGRPLHPVDIADAIAKQNLVKNRGASPATTVARKIAESIQKQQTKSPFMRSSPFDFALRSQNINSTWFTRGFDTALNEQELRLQSTGYLNAYGMFWERSEVSWTVRPRLFGQHEAGTIKVNFCKQSGVYLLHDQQGILHVGRAATRDLGDRLLAHTKDRLRGRWTRFSWFGIYAVQDSGALDVATDTSHLDVPDLCAALEAILIESIEPRQNRKRGDGFRASEFLQVHRS